MGLHSSQTLKYNLDTGSRSGTTAREASEPYALGAMVSVAYEDPGCGTIQRRTNA